MASSPQVNHKESMTLREISETKDHPNSGAASMEIVSKKHAFEILTHILRTYMNSNDIRYKKTPEYSEDHLLFEVLADAYNKKYKS